MSCYTGIAVGIDVSLALLKDGRVTGWGNNSRGQITIPAGIGDNVTGIDCGYYFSIALLKDGRVTGWGSNQYGQIDIPAGIGNNAAGISAGSEFSLALLKDGRVTGWGGLNLWGETTIPVGIGTSATGISAGGLHSLALLKDGRVTGWGFNNYGQITIPPGIGNNAAGISAGAGFSLALLKNGSITGWGAGSTNQSNGGGNNNEYGQIIIPPGIGNNAAGISAGGVHSLALLKDGRVTGWGDNRYGQIDIPAGIGNNAVGISAGNYHSLALLKDGRVTGWGNNSFGQTNTSNCNLILNTSNTGYANIYVLFESNVSNRQPDSSVRPCPRINVFLSPFDPPDIVEPGFYKYNFFLNGSTSAVCGLDTIAWNYIGGVGVKEYQDIEIETCPNLPIVESRVGEFNDQIKKQIIIDAPGNYYFRIKIT